jgi:alkanesulfonate monooxygenase SsuD/methylene tetrahydromethanopterin reductase-like flavin-dependent oxidoreductase (luciferase family)
VAAEQLVFTTDVAVGAYPGADQPPISPYTLLFDAPAYLCALAAATTGMRLGTAVYLFGLRHGFVSARAFATLDQISGGRAIVGVGPAGTRASGWRPALDFASGGLRLDEALRVARSLWERPTVAWDGEFLTLP